jgi:hypothetical protein
MKLTERIRRENFGRLDIELTVDDSKAYTEALHGQCPPAGRG